MYAGHPPRARAASAPQAPGRIREAGLARVRGWVPCAILLLYVALGVLYAALTPLWQNPDEPAHYNYVKQIAATGQLPVMQVGDYPAAYLEELKSRRFPADMPVDAIRYEGWQPPLYYLLSAGVYLAASALPLAGQVLVLRLFSVAIGALLIWTVYRLAREVLGDSPLLAWGAMAFPVVVPMHLAMLAAINNDGLAELLVTATLLGCVRLINRGATSRRLLVLGVLLGLGLLTKNTTAIVAPVILLSVWLSAERRASESRWAPWLRALGGIGLPALLLSGGWYLRNALVYGWGDPLIWRRHGEVVAGQLTTAQYLATRDWGQWLGDLVMTTFRSFWAQFGWMAVPIDHRIYWLLGVLSGLATVGFALWLVRRRRAIRGQGHWLAPPTLVQMRVFAVLASAVLLTLALFLGYNVGYVQFQGRYLFPAIAPLGMAFVLGWRELLQRGPDRWLAIAFGVGAWMSIGAGIDRGDVDVAALGLLAACSVAFLLKKRIPARFHPAIIAAIYAGLLALTAASPWLYIRPYLAP